MCFEREPAEVRGTGRTTNIVLALVRKALDNPGTFIEARDHWDNVYSHRGVARSAGRVLDALFVENTVHVDNMQSKSYIRVEPRRS